MDEGWEERHRAICTDTSQSGTANARTGPDGRFALSPLPFDRWVNIYPGHGAGTGIPNMVIALSEEKPEARLDLVLDPGGALLVEIRQPPGLPEKEVRFELRRRDGGMVFSGCWGVGMEPGTGESCRSHEDRGLAPGDYRLVVSADGLRAPGSPFKVRILRGRTTTVRVRLRESKSTRKPRPAR